MPRLLTRLDLTVTSPADLLDLVRAAMDGSGDALLPTGPGPADAVAEALQAGAPLNDDEDDATDTTAVVVATSGSTGRPKGVLLQTSALHASAAATHGRLGGPGHWLLALPAHHVAGMQVLVRSIVAGTDPGVLDLRSGFDVGAFVQAAELLRERASGTPAARRYTALVPTQLVRLLEAGGEAERALAGFDSILIGGASASPALLHRAREAGVSVVTTYGMSETCGGCVYDGVPLDGVRVALDDADPRDVPGASAGRIRLGGPMVARGYRGRPGAPQFTTLSGTRWFGTDDVGSWAPDGRLVVLGRADDVINTGGVKVSPQAIEAVLAELPGVLECLVVGVPDDEWGQRVVALVVGREGHTPAPDDLRQTVAARLGPAAAPRTSHLVQALPRKALGKPDRAAAARLAASLDAGADTDRRG